MIKKLGVLEFIANISGCDANDDYAKGWDEACRVMYEAVERMGEAGKELPMKVVDKKIIPLYFKMVESGDKRFELRKDEDDLQVGDRLCLHEWNGDYTGRRANKEIKYVLRNVPELGLMKGYCIVGW